MTALVRINDTYLQYPFGDVSVTQQGIIIARITAYIVVRAFLTKIGPYIYLMYVSLIP